MSNDPMVVDQDILHIYPDVGATYPHIQEPVSSTLPTRAAVSAAMQRLLDRATLQKQAVK